MRRALSLALLPLLAGCAKPAAPQVRHAWVRLPAVAGGAAAAYFELSGGRADERLVAVASALATRAELHESMAGGNMGQMAGMVPLAAVAVPAGGTVRFAPGGRHVMLWGLDKVVVPGTAVPLRLGFASGHTAEGEAKTVAAGAPAPY